MKVPVFMNIDNLKVSKFKLQDLKEYSRLAETFYQHSTIKDYSSFDLESFTVFLKNCLTNPDIVILACKDNNKIVGITGGLLFPLYFNHNYKVAQELWWWVEEEYRGSSCGKLMYDALENWAKEKQADSMFMIALEDTNVERMARLYKRKGFVGTERTFIKELKHGN
jgi:GNAT superfamily N-acetyltransferase